MAIELPSGLAGLFKVLTGMPWPQGNEDSLRAVGKLYTVTSQEFDELADVVGQLVSAIGQGFEGETASAFVGSMKKLISGDDFLGAAKEGAAELAEFAEDTANQIEYMKWMTLATLIELAAELLFYAATSWFNWGAPAEAAAAEAVARFSILSVMKATLRRLLQHVVIGLVTAVTMDRLIQSIQKWQGHRTHYDDALLVQSIEFAVISSAVGMALEPLGGKLGGLLGDMLGHDFGKNVGDNLATFFKSDLGPLSAGETKAFASDLGRVAGDNSRGLANGFGKDTGAGVERESAGGPGRDALGGSFDENAVFAFRNDMGEVFARHLGGSLGLGQARELGRDFGDRFAAGWGRKALADVKNDLSDVFADYVGVLGKEGAESLAHDLPEAVLKSLIKGTGTDWGRKAADLVTAALSSGVNMTLTTGFYNLIFGPDHTFETSLDSFVGGAAMGALGRGGRMAIEHYAPNGTKIAVPDFDKEFGKGLAVRTEGEPGETAPEGTPAPSAGSPHGEQLPTGDGFRTTSTAGQDAPAAVEATTATAESAPAAPVRTSAQGRPSRTADGPGEEVAAPREVRSTSSTDAERGARDGAGSHLREPRETGNAVGTVGAVGPRVRTSAGGRADTGPSTEEKASVSRGAADSSPEVAAADGEREGSVPRGKERVPAGADTDRSAGDGPSRSAGVEDSSGRQDDGGGGEPANAGEGPPSTGRSLSDDPPRSSPASGAEDASSHRMEPGPIREMPQEADLQHMVNLAARKLHPDAAHLDGSGVVEIHQSLIKEAGGSLGSMGTPELAEKIAMRSLNIAPPRIRGGGHEAAGEVVDGEVADSHAGSSTAEHPFSVDDLTHDLRERLNRPELLAKMHDDRPLREIPVLERAEVVFRNPDLDLELAAALGRPGVGRDLAEEFATAKDPDVGKLRLKLGALMGRPEFASTLRDRELRASELADALGLELVKELGGRTKFQKRLAAALKKLEERTEPRVLMHPGYATGDQFGIAAALMGDKDLHVVVVTGMPDKVATDKGPSIAKFYKDSGIDEGRVHLVTVNGDKKADTAAAPVAGRILGVPASAAKKKMLPVGAGTTWVADNFSVETRRLVRAHWKLDDAGFTAEEKSHLGDWLSKKGIAPSPDRDTIVLWSRFSGKKGDVHVEHDTSYTGIDQILEELRRHKESSEGKGPLVVIAGDAFANEQRAGKYPAMVEKFTGQGLEVHNLTRFWETKGDAGEQAALKAWGGDSRIGQMKLYEYLRQNCADVRHLGFRSGNLEALAMSGHTVRYMEEPASVGGERMANWHAAQNSLLSAHGTGKFVKGQSLATGYERIHVKEPPTRSGKYIADEMKKLEERRKELANEEFRARNNALLHPDWAFGAHKGVAKPAEASKLAKGFAAEDLVAITHYLTGRKPPVVHGQPGMVVRPRAPKPGPSTGTDAVPTATPEPEVHLAAENARADPEPAAPSTVVFEADLTAGLRTWLNRPELLDTLHNGERLGAMTDLQRAELLLQHPELDPHLAAALGRPDVGRDLAEVMLPKGTAEDKADLAAKISAAVVRPEFREVLHDPSLGKALAKEMGYPATGPKVVKALKDRELGPRVLWQPGYATGDQFGIAAALMGDKDLHVVVVTGMPDRVATDKGASIEKFYKDSGIDPARIHLVKVEDGQEADAAATVEAIRILGPKGSEVKKRLVPVGTGTTWVADHFSVETRRLVRARWKLDDAGFSAAQKSHLGDWLGKKGIAPSPDRDTVVLWSRFSGKKGDVHVEHDTSYKGIEQILGKLKLEKERTGGEGPLVVIAGDAFADSAKAGKYPDIARKFSDQGLEVHDLTHFWDPDKDAGAHAALESWGGDSRIGQMKLYEYLRQNSGSVRHLGFRSGNLEALAMSGHTVRYMEEPASVGGERMAKWHAAQNSPLSAPGTGKFGKGQSLATGYERILVKEPPTRSGKYIAGEMARIKDLKDAGKLSAKDAKAMNDALLHPDWAFGARKGVLKPEETSKFRQGFAAEDLDRITHYLTGRVHSLSPRPAPPVAHEAAPHPHETVPPHTQGTSHGDSRSTVTPRAPVPSTGSHAVAHLTVHDVPAATHGLKQAPKTFLDRATVLMRTSDGMKARTPGLAMDYEKFIKWMDGKDRHWFTLTPHADSSRAGREVYLLTPAVEKYAHEFADDPALRQLLDGHALPGLRGEGEYLAAHYVPYLQGKPLRPEAEIGHADIPLERDDGFSPDFVFTAAMNGCAFTVTRGQAEGTFRAWHFQSPTTNRDESELFRLDRRPMDWFGDGEYQSPLDQSVAPETTNIMWRGDDGWHFVSQENLTTRENVNEVWTRQVSSRPVHFDGSHRLDYVLRFYTRTTEDRLLRLSWYHRDYTSRLDSSPSSLHLKSAWTLHTEQARKDVEALGGVRSLEDLNRTLAKLAKDHKATQDLVQHYLKEQEKALGEERFTVLRKQATSLWPGAKSAEVRRLDELKRLQGQVRFWIDDLSDTKWLPGLQKEAAGLTEHAPEPPAVSAPAPAGHPAQSTPQPVRGQGAPAYSGRWQDVRAMTAHVTRSHRWVDPVSRPLGGVGHNVPRYVVESKFDVRRFDVGRHRYTDLTVKVHMDGTGPVTAGQLDGVWARAQAGVDRLFNAPGHTLPDGSVLHVTLERTESVTAAHLNATVGPHGTPSSQDTWAVDADDQVLAHELGHQLGLRDEYRDATLERDTYLDTTAERDATSNHRPDVTGSLMGDFTRAPKDDVPRGGIRDRYLHLLNALIGDLDTAPAAAATHMPHAPQNPPVPHGGAAPHPPRNDAATTVQPGTGGTRSVAEDQIFRVLSAGTGADRDTPAGLAGDASSERGSGVPKAPASGPDPARTVPQLEEARQ